MGIVYKARQISLDGRRIVTSPGGAREFTIWDATSGQRLVTVETLVQQVSMSALSPDGQRLLTTGHDKTGRVWDTRTGQLLLRLKGHTRYFHAVAWSPSGERIATGSKDGTARIWRYADGTQETCEVAYGQDVQDWWFKPNRSAKDEPAPGRVVWQGSNPRATEAGQSVRLYLRSWANPRPDAVVQSLAYVSALTESAPFLIALTVE